MKQTIHNDAYEKKAVIVALAQQNPSFLTFCEEYKDIIKPEALLPPDFVDEVFTIIKSDPSLASSADTYLENAQKTTKYNAIGIPEASIILASLFLLGSHIKIHKTTEGKWEFLFDHESIGGAAIEKIADILAKFFKQ